jgi:hypothetical protein
MRQTGAVTMKRWNALAVAVVVSAGLAVVAPPSTVSATQATSKTGTIIGIASPCTGTFLSNRQSAKLRIKVTLAEASRITGTEIVHGLHEFRFTVLPGNYVVSSNQSPGAPVRDVVLEAGKIVRASTTCLLA